MTASDISDAGGGQDIGAVLYRSAMLVAAKRPAPAENLLRQALAVHPGDARLLAALSEVVLDLGRPEDAESLARAAVAARPEAATWANLSKVLLARYDTAAALTAARRAIQLAPHHSEAYCLAALSLAATVGHTAQQHAEARALVGYALELAPPSAFACLVAGDVERIHDPAAARGWYAKALELEPMNVVAMMRLADTAGGTPSGNVLLTRSVLALDPLNVSAQDRLAEAVTTALRRFGVLGQLAALLAAFGAVWFPANGIATLVLIAGTALLLGAWRALDDVTRPLPATFVRVVRRGTARARLTTASCLAVPVLAGTGLVSLLVRGGDRLPGDVLLALAVLAFAPANVLQLQAAHDRMLVEGLPHALHRQVTDTFWRPAARPLTAWGLLTAATVGCAVVGWAPHPVAAAVFAVLVSLMTAPLAAARLVHESRAPGGRRRPSTAAFVLAGAAAAELAAAAAIIAAAGDLPQ